VAVAAPNPGAPARPASPGRSRRAGSARHRTVSPTRSRRLSVLILARTWVESVRALAPPRSSPAAPADRNIISSRPTARSSTASRSRNSDRTE
jgi:hypothetical protein